MARFLKAIQAYGPRLAYNRTADTAELAETLAARTGFKYSQLLFLFRELHEVIVSYGCKGTPVHLDGIGRFRPTISRDGTLRLSVAIDRSLANAFDNPSAYRGKIINRAHIGLDNAGYQAVWDAAHPEDPLDLPVGESRETKTSRLRAKRWAAR